MTKPINLVLCWHMHQPHYKDGLDGNYQLPWVYLHGIKDYDDMAAHLERYPQMKAVVNFAPVLLEQLDDYANQLNTFLDTGDAMQDQLLNWLSGASPVPADPTGRKRIIELCSKAYGPRMIEPHPQYQALLSLCNADGHIAPEKDIVLSYLDEQYFIDLLMWYHLSWTSYTLKQTPVINKLLNKASKFTSADRNSLLQAIHDCLASIIPRYRALAERGQVELSMTPYGHPIIPLLNDFENMRDAQPDDPMPSYDSYPGGSERSRWHMKKGLQVFEHYFGHKPKGVWLSEGAVSDDSIALLDEMNIQWTASGEAVWHHSCHISACDPSEMECRKALFIPYRLEDYKTDIFFRDDGLSDLIGFEYSKWHADDAAADFLEHLKNIAITLGDDAPNHVVSVILDGENAWEYYPDNAHYFLDALYQALSTSEFVRTTTFAGTDDSIRKDKLTHLVAGSWVYGSYSTWIGSTDKNKGWDMLVEAKQAYDKVMAGKKLTAGQRETATNILAICEGSDWFWWFGDYNPSGSVNDFDHLYRSQLKSLYCALQLPPPASLDTPLSQGGGDVENAGTMRRN